jgi:hypothetical protein
MDFFEYLLEIVPDVEEPCAGCGKSVQLRVATIREMKVFCSDTCADRTLAILVKPQPAGVQIEGWDV